MPDHATVPERDLDPGFGDSRLADVPNRPVDPTLADLLADQGALTVLYLFRYPVMTRAIGRVVDAATSFRWTVPRYLRRSIQ